MADEASLRASKGGLTLRLYRGEGAALLGFNLTRQHLAREFVGFAVEVRYPGSTEWWPLRNRLAFAYPPGSRRSYSSLDAPFQKFRWVHVPREVGNGNFRYRVTTKYMRADDLLVDGPQIEAGVNLAPQTIGNVVDVGFTRGFASSQAYAERFGNETRILPSPTAGGAEVLAHDMAPFAKHYDWLGFEARRLIVDTLDRAAADPALSVDALIYECKEPDILRRLLALGPRLRAIVDDHGHQKLADSAESISAARLAAAGAQVKRLHFGRQQHNKALVVRRRGVPVQVLTGSTNFSLRGLYIQANNVLLFRDRDIAAQYAALFDAYWADPRNFRKTALARQWWTPRQTRESIFSFCFSPHRDAALSLDPVARAIAEAQSSVLYSMVFLNQLSGPVREALNALVGRPLFSYGTAQRTGGLAVQKPDGSVGLLPFGFLGQNAPPPFRAEWDGNTSGRSNMVHHKFVVADFNGARPMVFTGSSNMAAGGEKANGDNLICIQDRRVAAAYMIEALRLFDHFHFRVKLRETTRERAGFTLRRPPLPGRKAWFDAYYEAGSVKLRDRALFAG